MDFGRRLRLYLFGLLIGCVLAWLFLGDRLANAGWTPEERIKKRLVATLVKASPAAQKQLDAWPSDLMALRAAIPSADVIVNSTRRQTGQGGADSLFYTLKAGLNGKQANIEVVVIEPYERDSTATLIRLTPL